MASVVSNLKIEQQAAWHIKLAAQYRHPAATGAATMQLRVRNAYNAEQCSHEAKEAHSIYCWWALLHCCQLLLGQAHLLRRAALRGSRLV